MARKDPASDDPSVSDPDVSNEAESALLEDDWVLTPEIMQRENRRNDVFLAIGALTLAFFLGAFKEAGGDLFLRFRTGALIDASFPSPPAVDSLSYTAEGKPWVNPSWFFDWSTYRFHQAAGDVPLTFAKTMLCVGVAAALLCLRYPGPTLWWSAVTTTAALVAMSVRMNVGPEIVATALLVVILLVAHQAFRRDMPWLLAATFPIAVLWANVDLTYVIGGLSLLAMGLGGLIQKWTRLAPAPILPAEIGEPSTPRGKLPLGLLLAGLAALLAGMVTPYGIGTLWAPIAWFRDVLPNVPEFELIQTGWVGLSATTIAGELASGTIPFNHLAYGLLATFGLASFLACLPAVNLSRLGLFALGVALPMVAARFLAPAAVLLATTLALNGQEFFLHRWGTESRITRGWLFWSQGGRAASIVFLFLATFASFTGRIQGLVGRFGFGILENRFMVDGAGWLKESGLRGNGFAFVNQTASYGVWADPDRKNFVDARWQLFADGVLAKYSQARQALQENKPEVWRKIFDEYKISYLILDPEAVANHKIISDLFNTPALVPIHISDHAVIFGRTDPTVDIEAIKKHFVDANRIMFRDAANDLRVTPNWAKRSPSAPSFIDWVWRSRLVAPKHFLTGRTYTTGLPGAGVLTLGQPGADYLAIQQLREAISENPDYPEAHFFLGLAYNNLFGHELSAVLSDRLRRERQFLQAPQTKAPAKNPPTGASECEEETSAPANAAERSAPPATGADANASQPRIVVPPTPPSASFLPLRHFEITTAMQHAILTGADRWQSHFFLAGIAWDNEYLDLALREYQEALARIPRLEELEPFRRQCDERLKQLTKVVAEQRAGWQKVVDGMQEEATKQGYSGSLTPQRAVIAFNQFHLPLLAIEEIETLSQYSTEFGEISGFGAKLYLRLGLPEKADAMLANAQSTAARGAMGLEPLLPGEFYYLQAHARLGSGYYRGDESTPGAIDFLKMAINEVRQRRALLSLNALEGRIRFGNLTDFRGDSIIALFQQEALYLAEFGLLQFEMGEPKAGLRALKQSIELSPRMPLRPIVAYYAFLVEGQAQADDLQPYRYEDELVEPRPWWAPWPTAWTKEAN